VAFHRLTTPTYLGGLLAGHDYINNTPGDPTQAPADGPKVGGPNAGTLFDAFGEDATSAYANRGNKALAQNCDELDDVVSTPTPVIESVAGASVGVLGSLVIAGSIFVGKSGTTNNQYERDRLVSVVDATTGNDLVDATGLRVQASLIEDGTVGHNNVVGTAASGFYTNPTVNFNPAIPASTSYRLFYGRASRLSDITDVTLDIGSLIGTGIRSAHAVPAESTRFMRESSRRATGTVEALACTVLETPGIGDNILAKANQLWVSIDPDGTVGGVNQGGEFHVRFQVSSFSADLFAVCQRNVALSTESYWGNFDDAIRLLDANTLDGFTSHTSAQRYIPLSGAFATGDGDYLLRVGDTTHGATRQPTILKSLNARVAITVGDGTDSFGDFNGVTALQDAIAFVQSRGGGPQSVHIIVKPGSYTISSTIDWTAGGDRWVIEGSDFSRSCVIYNTIAGAGIPMCDIGGGDVTVVFKNLALNCATASKVLAEVEDCTELRFVDCAIGGQRVTLKGGVDLAKFVDCAVTANSGHACVEANVAAGTTVPYRFIRCSFHSATSYPVLRIRSDLAAPAVFAGALFEDCDMYLASTTLNLGDPVGNPGVLQIDPNGNNLLTVQEIAYLNCRVRANYLTAGTCSILMYLRTYNGARYVTLQKLTIKGGRWECPAVDTELTPFYVGGEQYSDDAPYIPQKVIIDDVDIGFVAPAAGVPGAGYGVGSVECGFAPGFWGAIFIKASSVLHVHDLRFICATIHSGTSGELWLGAPSRYDVQGVHVEARTDGAPAADKPLARARVDGNNSSGAVRDLVINAEYWGEDATDSGALVLAQPNGRLVLQNCEAIAPQGFPATGFQLVDGATATLVGLTLEACHTKFCDYGFCLAATSPVKALCLSHNTFEWGGTGVYLRISGYFLGLRIVDNHVHDNNTLGVLVAATSWPAATAFHSMAFNNNAIYNNGADPHDTQVQFGDLHASYDDMFPKGVFWGNTLGNDEDAVGGLGAVGVCSSGTPGPGLTDDACYYLDCLGLETHVHVNGAADTYYSTLRTKNNEILLHNVGYFKFINPP
jgi:hypothetical protein